MCIKRAKRLFRPARWRRPSWTSSASTSMACGPPCSRIADDLLHRPVKRTLKGRYRLRLSSGERDVLRTLPEQLIELLDGDNPSLRRLFPPAFEDDPERNAEYQRLMREDLVERHRAALDTMARTVDATELSTEELTAW